MQRAATVEKIVNFLAHLHESSPAFRLAYWGKSLLAGFLVGADQHGVFNVDGILQQSLPLGVAERGSNQEISAEFDQFHRLLGFGEQASFGLDVAHIAVGYGTNPAASI